MCEIIGANKNVNSFNEINFLIEQLFLQKIIIIRILVKINKSSFSIKWARIQVRFGDD